MLHLRLLGQSLLVKTVLFCLPPSAQRSLFLPCPTKRHSWLVENCVFRMSGVAIDDRESCKTSCNSPVGRETESVWSYCSSMAASCLVLGSRLCFLPQSRLLLVRPQSIGNIYHLGFLNQFEPESTPIWKMHCQVHVNAPCI